MDSASYNLRPFTTRIVDAITNKLKACSQQDTLFVFMGEDHNQPADKALQHMVLKRLTEIGLRVSYGYELWADELGPMLKSFGAAIGEQDLASVARADRVGVMLLQASLAYPLEKASYPAPVSMACLWKFCLDAAIPYRQLDAAKEANGLLRYETLPDTDEIKSLISGRENIHALDKEGMAVRNLVMSDNLVKFSKDTGPQVCVVQTGYFHVAGAKPVRVYHSVSENHPFETSLTGIFQKRGLPLIGVVPHDEVFGPHALPEQVRPLLDSQDILVLAGLPRVTLGRHAQQEKNVLTKIYNQSGNELDLPDLDRVQRDARTFVERLIERLAGRPFSHQAVFGPGLPKI